MVELYTSCFTASSAQYLIDTNTANIKKLNIIYREAVSFVYILWTGKTVMRLVTLSDIGSLTFDIDDERLKLYTIVYLDDYDNKLKGRYIMLIIYPLLQVYRIDKGRDYDNVRV